MEPQLPRYYQYFSGSLCVFAQGHKTVEVGIEPRTSRSGVRDSTTMPPRSPKIILSRLSKEAPHKTWLSLAKQFQRRCLKIMAMYMYIASGQGQTCPLGSRSFQKHKSSVNLVICCKFYPLNEFVTFFPFKRIGGQI